MKKLLLIFSVFVYCQSGYAQTLSTSTTVQSGVNFTMTAVGEETVAQNVNNSGTLNTSTTNADGPPQYVSMSNGGVLCPNGPSLTLSAVYSGTITNYNWTYSGTGLVVVSGGTPNSNTITVRAVTGFTGGMVKMQPSNSYGTSQIYTQWTPPLSCQ